MDRPIAREDRAFVAAGLITFAVSAVVTVLWSASMTGMPRQPMPGGWTLSMTWAPMCGRDWTQTVTGFIGMWMLMMVAMMGPVVAPALRRYRARLDLRNVRQRDQLTGMAALGYLGVWTALGLLLLAGGCALVAFVASVPALSRAVPLASALVLVFAGLLQFTRWKLRQLDCCRRGPMTSRSRTPGLRQAWRHGAQLGVDCIACCAGFTAVLLVLGVMDLRAMAAVMAAIVLERLSPAGASWARASGGLLVLAGAFTTGLALSSI